MLGHVEFPWQHVVQDMVRLCAKGERPSSRNYKGALSYRRSLGAKALINCLNTSYGCLAPPQLSLDVAQLGGTPQPSYTKMYPRRNYLCGSIIAPKRKPRQIPSPIHHTDTRHTMTKYTHLIQWRKKRLHQKEHKWKVQRCRAAYEGSNEGV